MYEFLLPAVIVLRRCSMLCGIKNLLIRRPFLCNLPHELFSSNHPLPQSAASPVRRLWEAGDEKLFQRDRFFIWFVILLS